MASGYPITGEGDDGSNDPPFEKQSEHDLRLRMRPIPLTPGEHKLESFYTLWYSRRLSPSRTTKIHYNDLVKAVISFQSVEQFWRIHLNIMAPSQFPTPGAYHVFKNGIKPMWEDPANKQGGKWFAIIRKKFIDRCWENLLLALVGEQFIVGDELTGVVIRNRSTKSVVSVWTRTSGNENLKNRIRDSMRRVMQLPQGTPIEYRKHAESLNAPSNAPPHAQTNIDEVFQRGAGFSNS